MAWSPQSRTLIWRRIPTRVKQGCVLAATRFSMVPFHYADGRFRYRDISVGIRYRINDKPFQLRRLLERQNAWRYALWLPVRRRLCYQWEHPLTCRAAWTYSLIPAKISASQFLQRRPVSCSSLRLCRFKHHIIVNGQWLAAEGNFIYLASTSSANIDKEVVCSIAGASADFGRLKYKFCERRGQKLNSKLKVYRAVVIRCLFYACETLTAYSRQAKKLEAVIFQVERQYRRHWSDPTC